MADYHEKALEFINRGISLMRHEKYSEAKEAFSKALEAEPKNYEAHMHLGNALVNLGQMEDAIFSFQNALTIQSDSGEALFSIGNVYFLQDDYRRAVKYYNKAECTGYQPVDMYLIMAEIFHKAEDVEQALRCINHALKVAPLRGDIWRQKVLLLIGMDKLDAAQETLDEFVELLPDALDAYDIQARLLCGQEKYEEALQRLQPALERFPEDPQIRLVELHIYVESGDDAKAKTLIQMMKERGMDTGCRKRLGMEQARIQIAENASQEAIDTLEWALEETPEDSQLLYMLLSAYIGLLKYEKIVTTADRILKLENLEPSLTASARFYRALSLKETRSGEQAKIEFRKLSNDLRKLTIENPGMTDIYMLRLLCHCELGEYDKAFDLVDYLQSISPDSADGHAYRHLIYKQMGDSEKAEQELAEVRKINPDLVE